MATAHVAYDVRSGRIISVHHGDKGAYHVADVVRHVNTAVAMQGKGRHRMVADEDVAVIQVSSPLAPSKAYRVDVATGQLVEAKAGEEGVNFGLGGVAGTSG
jgi:hypothetical protein